MSYIKYKPRLTSMILSSDKSESTAKDRTAENTQSYESDKPEETPLQKTISVPESALKRNQ